MKLFNQKHNQGFSIVEIMVVVGILSFVLVALLAGMTMSIKNSTLTNNRNLATQLANEAMEAFHREMILSGWNGFDEMIDNDLTGNYPVIYCMNQTQIPLHGNFASAYTDVDPSSCKYILDVPDSTAYYKRLAKITRKVNMNLDNEPYYEVEIQVSWKSSNNKTHEVKIKHSYY